MPPNVFLSANSRSSGQQKNDTKTLFSTLHPLSPLIFATATLVAFVLVLVVTLRPLATSCAKDYKGHSLVQTSFTEPPNMQGKEGRKEGRNLVFYVRTIFSAVRYICDVLFSVWMFTLPTLNASIYVWWLLKSVLHFILEILL